MRKIFLFVFLAFFGAELFAQNPQYRISVKHDGEYAGDIVLELFPDIAPKHVANFDSLVSVGFYNGLAFHRVIPGFMIQGGGPKSRAERNLPKYMWGVGDPDQRTVPAEFSSISHTRGILSTARLGTDINSATSQFFIVHQNSPHLDGKYTAFGKVIEGMNIVDYIANVPRETVNGVPDIPVERVEMTIAKLGASSVENFSFEKNFSSTANPNPAFDNIEIKFSSENSGLAMLEIFSLTGEKILQTQKKVEAGTEEKFLFSAMDLPEGTYMYRISLGEKISVGKIIRTAK